MPPGHARRSAPPPLVLGFALACTLATAASGAGPSPGGEPGGDTEEGLAPRPHGCPIVQRGFVQDGITTITGIVPPAPCNVGPVWAGWQCMTLQSDANAREGPTYRIQVRWNLVGGNPDASFTWMIGDASTVFLRDVTSEAQRVQDTLAAENVRTIEMAFLNSGTNTMPRNGYPNISAVYADLLEYLVEQGIAVGIRGSFGNSGGGLMTANALAYQRVKLLLDGVVYGSSPFWTDLEPVCADPTSPYYGSQWTRARADVLNWTDVEGTSPCTAGAPEADPSYGCRSLLGPDADTDYPNLFVSVVLGTQDTLLAWIDPSATEYLRRVNTFQETFDIVDSGHNLMNWVAGADMVLLRIREIVAGAKTRNAARESPAESGTVFLESAAPSPARDGTLLRFGVSQPGRVVLTVHDVTGRRVASLLDGVRSAGSHSVRWSGADDAGRPVASGIYFARLRVPGGQRVTRIPVIR